MILIEKLPIYLFTNRKAFEKTNKDYFKVRRKTNKSN